MNPTQWIPILSQSEAISPCPSVIVRVLLPSPISGWPKVVAFLTAVSIPIYSCSWLDSMLRPWTWIITSLGIVTDPIISTQLCSLCTGAARSAAHCQWGHFQCWSPLPFLSCPSKQQPSSSCYLTKLAPRSSTLQLPVNFHSSRNNFLEIRFVSLITMNYVFKKIWLFFFLFSSLCNYCLPLLWLE